MKTLEQIKTFEGGENCKFIDGRDRTRLACFLPIEDWNAIGVELREGAVATAPEPLTEENVIRHLAEDLAFAFEKALNKRGISASLMLDVVKMWLWVLDDELANDDEYAQYGLPILKKAAVKYGLPNPIGDDYGNECRYSSHGDD